MSTIDAAVGWILFEMDRFGLLHGGSKHQVTPEPLNADEQVVQQTAQDAATLLKNDGGATQAATRPRTCCSATPTRRAGCHSPGPRRWARG